jgi:hypothetical protein
LRILRQALLARVPGPEVKTPEQPPFQPKTQSGKVASGKPKSASVPSKKALPRESAEVWKSNYFLRNPQADENRDGKLTWPEYKAYREKFDPAPAGK